MSAALLQVFAVRHAFSERAVLDTVDLSLLPGQLAVVVGPNGSGKTTLIRVLCGVLRPASGRVLLGSAELGSFSRREIAQRIAVVPQELIVPFPYRVREMVAMGRAPHVGPLGVESARDRETVERAIESLGLWELAERVYSTLSGGERQRVLLARALAQETPLLLLDEPTAHMDLGHGLHTFEWLRRWIEERPDTRAVLLVTHDLSLAARFADRVVLMNAGRVVAEGTPGEVLTPEHIAGVYDVESEVRRDAGGRLVIVAVRSRIRYTARSDGQDH